MTTTLTRRSDEEIQRDVLAELKWDARVGPNEIGVIVKDGIVTLTGWLDSHAKKWAAREAGLRVDGVRAVVDEIEVRLLDAAQPADVAIAATALQALEANALVPAEQIEITVSKGVVTLQGTVDWPYQREEAERVVQQLAGVRKVLNLIMLRPHHRSPAQLKQEIEEALARDAQTDARHIQVEVREDGTVILAGRVRSWAEREAAERAVWRGTGVTRVENEITVEPD